MFYNVCSTKSNLSSEYASSLLHPGLHRRVDSNSSGEEKHLDPVTIAAKSVSYTLCYALCHNCLVTQFYVTLFHVVATETVTRYHHICSNAFYIIRLTNSLCFSLV